MSRQLDVMLDLETLGNSAGCVILTIGAVAFDPRGHQHEISQRFGTRGGIMAFNIEAPQFSCRIDMIDSMKRGLAARPETLKWWMQQDAAARHHAFDAGVGLPLAEALYQFNEWGRSFGKNVKVWCHGATFDVPIIAKPMQELGIEPFWRYDRVRDTRTVYELAGVNLHDRTLRYLPGHNALYDAARQAIAVQRCYAIFDTWSRAYAANVRELEAKLSAD